MNGLFNPSTPTKNIGSSLTLFNASGRPADRQTGRPADRQTGKINRYKQSLVFAFLMICSTFITPQQSYGQFSWPVMIDDLGDTIPNLWPPDTSTFTKNEVIIKFKPDALNLNILCYDWMFENNNDNKKSEKVLFSNSEDIMTYLSNERFNIDELIIDSALRSYLHSIGGDTLRRITFANPCMDTLSITRTGDTIACTDYLWMTLQINNDNSVVTSVIALNYLYENQISLATPNYLHKLLSPFTPDDLFFLPFQQKGMDMIGARIAWDFQKGKKETKVAVIDIGIDYRHCDLGKGWGPNFKVKDGWSYTTGDKQFHLPESGHGTAIAGIIGAYTNFHECTTKDSSIAGVAGGLGGKNGEPGVSLYALKTGLTTEHIISSVRLSSTNSAAGMIELPGFIWHYGFGCHILNCSFTGHDEAAEQAEREAYNYAYENKALIVAGRGQYNIEDFPIESNVRAPWLLPSCEDARKVLSVGGSMSNKRKAQYSWWNNPTDGRTDHMDILAPGGDCANANERLAFTTFGEYDYNCFSHTSASTAYASGVAALIHASSLSWQYLSRDGIEPEDYQGIIAASALDIKDDQFPSDDRYGDLYDDATGYGHLQANKIYEMLDDNYMLFHVTVHRWQDSSAFTFSNWVNIPKTVVAVDRDTYLDKDLVKGIYTGKRRYVYFEKDISMSDIWGSNPNFEWQIDDNHKAYIWTRGANHSNKGRSGFNPQFQINSSVINSGYGGIPNGTGMNIHDNVNNITSKTKVKITYNQWEFTDGPTNILPYPITKPNTEDMGVNFSVFVKVKPKTTSVNADIINDDYVVKTLMSENMLSVKSLKNTSISTLTLVNNLGIEVASVNGVNISSLSIRNISSGVYFLNVKDNQNYIKTIPVRIVR